MVRRDAIREMTYEDIPEVGQVWLTTSIAAHDFVPAEFWRADLKTMTTEILPHPQTEGYVFKASGEIIGFISLGGHHVGCLFVLPTHQAGGAGTALLDHAKERHPWLKLTAYRKNEHAVSFYQARGFRIIGESICPHTGCEEYVMAWEGKATERTPSE